MKYAKPPKKSTRNKAQRPKETHNHSGEIDPIKSCTQSEMEIFYNLGIAEIDVKETYLAAFLAFGYVSLFFLGGCQFDLSWSLQSN